MKQKNQGRSPITSLAQKINEITALIGHKSLTDPEEAQAHIKRLGEEEARKTLKGLFNSGTLGAEYVGNRDVLIARLIQLVEAGDVLPPVYYEFYIQENSYDKMLDAKSKIQHRLLGQYRPKLSTLKKHVDVEFDEQTEPEEEDGEVAFDNAETPSDLIKWLKKFAYKSGIVAVIDDLEERGYVITTWPGETADQLLSKLEDLNEEAEEEGTEEELFEVLVEVIEECIDVRED